MKIHENELKKLKKAIRERELEFEIAKSSLDALKKTLADFERFNESKN